MRTLRPGRLRGALVLPTLTALGCGAGPSGEAADLVLRGGVYTIVGGEVVYRSGGS